MESLEVRFALPEGYADAGGRRHREGTMRPARVREEMRALSDFRVFLRPESFLPVMLARVIGKLGSLPGVDAGVIERLPRADLRHLERLYLEVNGYEPGSGDARGGQLPPGD